MVRPLVVWILVMALLQIAPVRADAPMTALISNLQGSVEIQKDGKWKGAALMDPLYEQTQLRLAADAYATLSFVAGGVRVKLAGPCTVAVQRDGVKSLAGGNQAVSTQKPEKRTAMLLPAGVNIDKMGGVTVRAGPAPQEEEAVTETGDSVVATLTPSLTWQATEPFDRFHLRIQSDGGSYDAQQETKSTSAIIARPLQYGQAYSVTLEGVRSDGTRSSTAFYIQVIDEKTARQLDDMARQAHEEFEKHADDVTPLVDLITTYESHELHAAALAESTKLVQLFPRDKNLYFLMYNIYKARHQKAEAAQALQKAVDLGYEQIR